MNKRGHGILSLKIRDKIYTTVDDFTYNLGYPKKETIDGGLSGNAGYTVKYQPAFVECTLSIHGNELKDIVDADDIEITIEFVDGSVAILSRCFYEGDGTFDALTGKLKCKFVSIKNDPSSVVGG